MLHKRQPKLSEDQTLDTARLINAALMAKIDTVEWTPAVISHPTTQRAMKINWWGVVGERTTRRFGRLTANEFISGIPGSPTEHHGVPYSLTEEFTAVYRMHPLLPDDYTDLHGQAPAEVVRKRRRPGSPRSVAEPTPG
jgi:hypothetical protein